MAMPPMVGVPALVLWCWGPSSRIDWPMLAALQSTLISTLVPISDSARATPAATSRRITRRHRVRAHSSATTTRSSNGRDDAADVLGGLVALAGDQHDVAGPAGGEGEADGDAPVGLDHEVGRTAGMDAFETLLHGLDDGRGVLADANCRP